MKEETKSLFLVHIAVFLFGFSSLFGKLINQSPITIVFGRVLFATITLTLILFYFKQKFKLESKKDFIYLTAFGGLFAIHWITFFQAVQLSNVAVAVLTFSTFPVFVTFMEPYFFKEKIKQIDIIVAITAFIGVTLIIPEFELKNKITQGAIWGIISGLTCAVLILFSRKYVRKYSSLLISFYQCATSTIILFPFIIFTKPILAENDLILLILLGVIFTALSHTLFIKSVQHIKAQLASIITCLEPVYGIIFAAIILNEIPSPKTFIGGCVILGAIIYATLKSKTSNQDKSIKIPKH